MDYFRFTDNFRTGIFLDIATNAFYFGLKPLNPILKNPLIKFFLGKLY